MLQGVTADSGISHSAKWPSILRVCDSKQFRSHAQPLKPGVTDGGMTQVEGINPGTLSPTAASISCRITLRSSFRTSLPRRAQAGAAPRESISSFILRPVATSLLMAAILLVGLVGYTQLPVSALPEVDYPTIQVLTFYPGASPNVMAATVTAPLSVNSANCRAEPDDFVKLRRHFRHRAGV